MDINSIINTIVMGLLTFFVYRATKASATAAEKTEQLTRELLELNKTTFALNKKLSEQQKLEDERYRNSLRIQYTSILLNKSRKILEAITSTDGMEIHRNLEKLDYQHGITQEELARSFAEDEVYLITKAFSTFEKYLENFFIKSYPGDTINLLVTNADSSIIAFEELKMLLQTQVRV